MQIAIQIKKTKRKKLIILEHKVKVILNNLVDVQNLFSPKLSFTK